MDDFLLKFFPVVYRHKQYHSKDQDYCLYNNQRLAAFTSSLYIAGLVATYFTSYTTKVYGRKFSILLGGLSFLIGAALNAGAENLEMLILGRIMLDVGIGFGNQAVPLYLSKMAPAKPRGALNLMFQLTTCIGIFAANIINCGTARIKPWGWRLSLGLAGVPALFMTLGAMMLPETPISLIERGQGHFEKGRAILEKVRGRLNLRMTAEIESLIKMFIASPSSGVIVVD